MTARARFKQADLTRALKGVIAAGIKPGKVTIDEHGRISILSEQVADQSPANPWDDELR